MLFISTTFYFLVGLEYNNNPLYECNVSIEDKQSINHYPSCWFSCQHLALQAKEVFSQAVYDSVIKQYSVLKAAIYGCQGLNASNSVVSLSQPWF